MICEKSIPILLSALTHEERLFFRNEGVPKYVSQVVIKYGEGAYFAQVKMVNFGSAKADHFLQAVTFFQWSFKGWVGLPLPKTHVSSAS